MTSSMTGYACVKGEVRGYLLRLEARSLNHRFFEFRARLPAMMSGWELEIENLAHKYFERGKIDLNVFIEKEPEEIELNWSRSQARAYLKMFKEMKKELDLKGKINLELLISQKNVMIIEPERWGKEVWQEAEEIFANCFEKLALSRKEEGRRLEQDLKARLGRIKELHKMIFGKREEVIKEIRRRLIHQLNQLLEDKSRLDDARLEQEVAYIALRSDITEELVRIESHLKGFENILSTEQAKGKRLDFLAQELVREFNTISAKAQDAQISQLVVSAKSELEKIREQLHNLE